MLNNTLVSQVRRITSVFAVGALFLSSFGFTISSSAQSSAIDFLDGMSLRFTADNGTAYIRSGDPIHTSEENSYSIVETVNDDGTITLSVVSTEYAEAGLYIDGIDGHAFNVEDIKSVAVETDEQSDPVGIDIWVDIDEDGEFFTWADTEEYTFEQYNDLGNDTYFTMLARSGERRVVVDDATEFIREEETGPFTFGEIKHELTGKRAAIWIGVYPEENGESELSATVTSITIELHADFADLHGHWAENDVLKLVDAGIISGYEDGTFRPDRTITRAEFTKMLVGAAGLTPGESPRLTFADADAVPEWVRDYVDAAVRANLVTGYGDNTFRSDALITREQLAVMIVRALGDGVEEFGPLTFVDVDSISDWAKNEVAAAVQAGIVTGMTDGTFRPNQTATRAEAATMLARFIEVQASK